MEDDQEFQQEQTPQRRQAPQKKRSITITIIIIIIITILIGGIIYIILSANYPDLFKPAEERTNPVETQNLANAIRLISYVIGGSILLIVGYLIYKNITKEKVVDLTKVPVPPDRAEELFIENFALRYEIQCIYDTNKKVYKPANRNAIQLINKHPYYHTATGDNFLLMEIEVSEGKRQGIHMTIIPIDRGEQTIKDGWYRIDTNTPKHTFQLNRNNYPLSSGQDKRERMQMAILDQTDDKAQALDIMQKMSGANNPNSIGTPLDSYMGEGMPSSVPYRRPYSPPRRRPAYNYRRRSGYY